MYRIPDQSNVPHEFLNSVIADDALETLKRIPDECIALVVTSPPYWNAIDYGGIEGQIGQSSYEDYIEDLVSIWRETYRVLIPNGKLAIVTPILPIPKSVINNQHTRHLKNINNDIEASILTRVPGLNRFSLYIWQKQTTTKMFGSYPYPPNIYEDNTVEFINVMVKEGPPPSIPAQAKEASKLTQEEWLNLSMQTWPIYPDDVRRTAGHPAPFPVVLPQRLIMMYTFQSDPASGFDGDIVLDMFNGAGATTLAAKAMSRNYIGIDLNEEYCRIARYRLATEIVNRYDILLEKPRVRAARNSRAVQMSMFPEDLY